MSTPRPSLRDSLADYLNLRRALGFQLANAGRLLEQFVGYLEQHGIHTVTTEHAVRWATLPADASRHWLAIRVSVVRGFTVYLHSIDSSAEVVPAGLIRPGRVGPRRTCTRSPRSDRSSRRRAGCGPGCGQPPTRA